MAYNPTSTYLGHLRRVVTGLADFKGRSSRTEFLAFLIVAVAIQGMALVLAELTTRRLLLDEYSQYLQLMLLAFAIPLFARRLHDQNRSGWLALILPAFLGLKLYGQILLDARLLPTAQLGFPFNVAGMILGLAFWVLVVWPGTNGANRFGQDPHLDLVANPS
jgi:uncharacterized membrane protein YhaH (DUF805 family)